MDEKSSSNEELRPRDWNNEPMDVSLVDDLANVLSKVVVGWKVDLAQHPEVVRVMARYRRSKE